MEERLPPLTFKCVKTFLAFKSLSVGYFRNLKVLEILSLLNSPTRLMCCRLYNFFAFLFARKAMSSICWRWRRMNFIWFPGKTFSAGFQGSDRGPALLSLRSAWWTIDIGMSQSPDSERGECEVSGTGRGRTCKEMNHKTKLKDSEKEWKEWKRTTEPPLIFEFISYLSQQPILFISFGGLVI